MLGLLGRGKIIVDLGGVTLGLDVGHLVNFLLRDEPASTQVVARSTAAAGPAAASPATSTSLIKGKDSASLGNNVILLRALEVNINFWWSPRIGLLLELKDSSLVPSSK
jgi:hypothetical protein